jgi:hypothetical protein
MLFDTKTKQKLRRRAAEGTRMIRTVDFDNRDLEHLIDAGLKLTSGIINASTTPSRFVLAHHAVSHWNNLVLPKVLKIFSKVAPLTIRLPATLKKM